MANSELLVCSGPALLGQKWVPHLSVDNARTAKATDSSQTVGPTPLPTLWFIISFFLLLITEELQYASPLPC